MSATAQLVSHRREKTIGSYLNSSRCGDGISEVATVEVTLQGTNGKDEFSALDFLLYLRMTDRSNIDLDKIVSKLKQKLWMYILLRIVRSFH